MRMDLIAAKWNPLVLIKLFIEDEKYCLRTNHIINKFLAFLSKKLLFFTFFIHTKNLRLNYTADIKINDMNFYCKIDVIVP